MSTMGVALEAAEQGQGPVAREEDEAKARLLSCTGAYEHVLSLLREECSQIVDQHWSRGAHEQCLSLLEEDEDAPVEPHLHVITKLHLVEMEARMKVQAQHKHLEVLAALRDLREQQLQELGRLSGAKRHEIHEHREQAAYPVNSSNSYASSPGAVWKRHRRSSTSLLATSLFTKRARVQELKVQLARKRDSVEKLETAKNETALKVAAAEEEMARASQEKASLRAALEQELIKQHTMLLSEVRNHDELDEQGHRGVSQHGRETGWLHVSEDVGSRRSVDGASPIMSPSVEDRCQRYYLEIPEEFLLEEDASSNGQVGSASAAGAERPTASPSTEDEDDETSHLSRRASLQEDAFVAETGVRASRVMGSAPSIIEGLAELFSQPMEPIWPLVKGGDGRHVASPASMAKAPNARMSQHRDHGYSEDEYVSDVDVASLHFNDVVNAQHEGKVPPMVLLAARAFAEHGSLPSEMQSPRQYSRPLYIRARYA